MASNSRSVALVVVGVVLVLVSLLADTLGIGAHVGVGWKQLLGAAIGLAVAVVGGLGLRSK
jgi:hypothetical protein